MLEEKKRMFFFLSYSVESVATVLEVQRDRAASEGD